MHIAEEFFFQTDIFCANIKTYLEEVKDLDGDRVENVKTRLKT